MTPHHALVYQSQATRPLDASDLDILLLDARINNELANVTGVLLYGDQQFVQYLEGARPDVEQIYARITRASQHHRLEILEQGRVEARRFQRWHMGFSDAPQTVVQQLSQAQWKRDAPWLDEHVPSSPGLARLLTFWSEQAILSR
ncbi:BLUF domain-containing protein [Pseudoxanthomonas sp. CF385]|uniref:BLUF domain-containing protein n=1 Tax=Pseudoxanthomonas sp. CF385 TaxID=1881042 RepID=UPI00158718F1|nr:BLUF domain-containing protein [Pseudoxanthomonas sp. CF385]